MGQRAAAVRAGDCDGGVPVAVPDANGALGEESRRARAGRATRASGERCRPAREQRPVCEG